MTVKVVKVVPLQSTPDERREFDEMFWNSVDAEHIESPPRHIEYHQNMDGRDGEEDQPCSNHDTIAALTAAMRARHE